MHVLAILIAGYLTAAVAVSVAALFAGYSLREALIEGFSLPWSAPCGLVDFVRHQRAEARWWIEFVEGLPADQQEWWLQTFRGKRPEPLDIGS